MHKKYLKIVVSLFLMILSPLILVGVAGAAVIISFWANGETTESAFVFLRGIFQTLYPLLPYLTGIPATLFVGLLAIKKRETIIKRFRN